MLCSTFDEYVEAITNTGAIDQPVKIRQHPHPKPYQSAGDLLGLLDLLDLVRPPARTTHPRAWGCIGASCGTRRRAHEIELTALPLVIGLAFPLLPPIPIPFPFPFARLPVVTQDLADTWVWGMGSDPVKVQRSQ